MGTGPKNSEENGPAEGGASEVPQLKPIRYPLRVTALGVMGLLALGLFYTLYFGRDFFLPLAIALVLSMLFQPIVSALQRIYIPAPAGAAVVLAGLVLVVGSGLFLLAEPANRWLENAPAHLQQLEGKLRAVSGPAENLSEAAARVENLAENGTDAVPKVELKKPGLLDTVWLQTKDFAYIAVEVFILLYFLLAVGDTFLLKLIQILPRLTNKKKAVEIVHQTRKGVSQYLLVMTCINLYEGTVIGTGLWLLGMPNPLLWGVLAFFANFIPYLGALVAGGTITLVALVTFESVGTALLAPAIYFGVNFMDNFIAPYLFGRRLVLNPLVVFLSVMFWGWLWGIPGVLLAVPITMTLKILCEHIPWLAPFAEFLASARNKSPEPEQASEAGLVKGNA